MAARAILTAFSTASAPLLNSAAFVAPAIGTNLAQLARKGDIRFVGRHHEARVLKLLQLLADAPNDARRRMAGIEAPNAAGEVEKDVSIDINETRPFGTLEEDAVLRFGNACGDIAPPLVDEGLAAWAGQGRADSYGRSRQDHFRAAYGNQ